MPRGFLVVSVLEPVPLHDHFIPAQHSTLSLIIHPVIQRNRHLHDHMYLRPLWTLSIYHIPSYPGHDHHDPLPSSSLVPQCIPFVTFQHACIITTRRFSSVLSPEPRTLLVKYSFLVIMYSFIVPETGQLRSLRLSLESVLQTLTLDGQASSPRYHNSRDRNGQVNLLSDVV